MLGSQFHPEFLSRPNAPHPLFLEFVKTVIREGRNRHNGADVTANAEKEVKE